MFETFKIYTDKEVFSGYVVEKLISLSYRRVEEAGAGNILGHQQHGFIWMVGGW